MSLPACFLYMQAAAIRSESWRAPVLRSLFITKACQNIAVDNPYSSITQLNCAGFRQLVQDGAQRRPIDTQHFGKVFLRYGYLHGRLSEMKKSATHPSTQCQTQNLGKKPCGNVRVDGGEPIKRLPVFRLVNEQTADRPVGQVEHPAFCRRHQTDGTWSIRQLCVVANPEPYLRSVKDNGFFCNERECDLKSSGGQAVDSVSSISGKIDKLTRLISSPSS